MVKIHEMIVKITNGKVIMDHIIEKNIYIKNGVIQAITNEDLPYEKLIDAGGKYISPGFIDTHVHGGGGADFMDTEKESVIQAARSHLVHGTTTILPTTLSDDLQEILCAVHNIREASDSADVPHIYGVHLEGPWLAPSQSGAMDPKYIVPIHRCDYDKLISASEGFVRKVSFAPELEGAEEFCKYLKEHHIVPSAGHTEATLDDIRKCREMGLKMATHLYSSMDCRSLQVSFALARK